MSKVQMRRFVVRFIVSLTLGFVALAGLHATAHGATAKASTKPSPVGTWTVTVYFNSGANAGQQEQQNITFNSNGTGKAVTTGGNVTPIGTTSQESWQQVSDYAFIYQFDESIYSNGVERGEVHGQVAAVFSGTGDSYAGNGSGTFILPNGTTTSFKNKTTTIAKLR